jgi:hypothetical protein
MKEILQKFNIVRGQAAPLGRSLPIARILICWSS